MIRLKRVRRKRQHAGAAFLAGAAFVSGAAFLAGAFFAVAMCVVLWVVDQSPAITARCWLCRILMEKPVLSKRHVRNTSRKSTFLWHLGARFTIFTNLKEFVHHETLCDL
jgi:hypothetical protein